MNYRKFYFEGKEYEIQISQNAGQYCVRAYLDGHPANGYAYCVDEPTGMGFYSQYQSSAVQHLVELAQSDVENKVWESYVSAHEKLSAEANA